MYGIYFLVWYKLFVEPGVPIHFRHSTSVPTEAPLANSYQSSRPRHLKNISHEFLYALSVVHYMRHDVPALTDGCDWIMCVTWRAEVHVDAVVDVGRRLRHHRRQRSAGQRTHTRVAARGSTASHYRHRNGAYICSYVMHIIHSSNDKRRYSCRLWWDWFVIFQRSNFIASDICAVWGIIYLSLSDGDSLVVEKFLVLELQPSEVSAVQVVVKSTVW